LCYETGRSSLNEYQNQKIGRKRLRTRKDIKFQVVSSDSEDDVDGLDPRFDSPRTKRRRTLATLSSKITRQTRSRRSTRLISLPNEYREDESDITLSDSSGHRVGTRRSSRTRNQRSSLRYEVLSDVSSDIAESEEPPGRSSVKPRVKKAVEKFPTDDDTEFAKRHQYFCMFSSDFAAIRENDTRKYVMCQGCSFMYHVGCLKVAYRQRIGHNVIILDEKDGEQICVLQCGKCSGGGKNGMNTIRCFSCGEVGDRCGDFKHPESTDDKLTGWNDVSKVMFRCMNCERACHFHHLPELLDTDDMQIDGIEAYTAEQWTCNECRQYNQKKVEVVLGWRTTDDTSDSDFSREYLVKFEDESYACALWVSATWLSGVAFMMKSKFDSRRLPAIQSPQDVIPDAWLRPDIIFDVQYDELSRDQMEFRKQSDELDAISKATSALCKWQKLKYEESNSPFITS
jgi:chromodomain-helicase-DNA-binding protein 4